jgi:hypothetical protein
MERQEVIVRDIQMPFGSMVVFMVKWTIASIPALVILVILGMIVAAVLGAVFRSIVGLG